MRNKCKIFKIKVVKSRKVEDAQKKTKNPKTGHISVSSLKKQWSVVFIYTKVVCVGCNHSSSCSGPEESSFYCDLGTSGGRQDRPRSCIQTTASQRRGWCHILILVQFWFKVSLQSSRRLRMSQKHNKLWNYEFKCLFSVISTLIKTFFLQFLSWKCLLERLCCLVWIPPPCRRHTVSSGALKPTWTPLISTLSTHLDLDFRLRLMTGELVPASVDSKTKQKTGFYWKMLQKIRNGWQTGPKLPLRTVTYCLQPFLQPVSICNFRFWSK